MNLDDSFIRVNLTVKASLASPKLFFVNYSEEEEASFGELGHSSGDFSLTTEPNDRLSLHAIKAVDQRPQ